MAYMRYFETNNRFELDNPGFKVEEWTWGIPYGVMKLRRMDSLSGSGYVRYEVINLIKTDNKHEVIEVETELGETDFKSLLLKFKDIANHSMGYIDYNKQIMYKSDGTILTVTLDSRKEIEEYTPPEGVTEIFPWGK